MKLVNMKIGRRQQKLDKFCDMNKIHIQYGTYGMLLLLTLTLGVEKLV